MAAAHARPSRGAEPLPRDEPSTTEPDDPTGPPDVAADLGTGRWPTGVERGLRVFAALMGGLVLGRIGWLAVQADISVGHLAGLIGSVLLLQVVPGAVVYRLIVRDSPSVFETVAVGGALGAVVAGLADGWGMRLGMTQAGLVLPIVGYGLLAVRSARARVMVRGTRLPAGFSIGVSLAGLLSLAGVPSFFSRNSAGFEGWGSWYVDMPFHLALAAEASNHGPESYPWVAGSPLQYHWLYYSWVSATVGPLPLDLDFVVLRSVPLLAAAALPALVAAMAVRISRLPWSGSAAALVSTMPSLVVAGAGFAAVYNPLSPTTFAGVATTVALLAVTWARGAGARSPLSWLVLVALSYAAAISKGSTLPVLMVGIGAAAAAAILMGSPRRRALLGDLAVMTLCMVAALVVEFRGGGGGLAIRPLAGVRRRLTGTLPDSELAEQWADLSTITLTCVALAVTVFWASQFIPTLNLSLDRASWPDLAMFCGVFLAGLAAELVLYHAGMSQSYFRISAHPVLAAGAGWGLVRVLQAADARQTTIRAGIAGAALWVALESFRPIWRPQEPAQANQLVLHITLWVALCVAVAAAVRAWGGGSALRIGFSAALFAGAIMGSVAALPLPAVPPTASAGPGDPVSWHRDHLEAAEWVRLNSDPDALVMTNSHCMDRDGAVCVAREFWLAAQTERRVVVEGWAYTPRAPQAVGTDSFWDPKLLDDNDAFIKEPTQNLAEDFTERGAQFVLLDRDVPGFTAPTESGLLTLRFENEHAQVFELTAEG